jgi:hypothetical protein
MKYIVAYTEGNEYQGVNVGWEPCNSLEEAFKIKRKLMRNSQFSTVCITEILERYDQD